MGTYIDSQGQERPDRRSNLKLREIYDHARDRVGHIFHRDDWAGSSIDFVANRFLHETYPELQADEIRTLVRAIGCEIGNRRMVVASQLA